MPKRPPGSTRALVHAFHKSGLSLSEIAFRLGVSQSTVAFHIRRLGIEPDERFARRCDWDEIQRAYDTGLSVRECARRFGFNLASWHQAKQRGDVVARPRPSRISEWQGRPLSMQLHHLNCDGTDNRLASIVFRCGNCHSQTDTYGGRNGHRRPASKPDAESAEGAKATGDSNPTR